MPIKILLMLTLLLSGCATHQAGTSNYELINSNTFENNPPPIAEGKEFSTLIIKRDSGFQASALPARIHLDGVLITNIKEGQYIELKVEPNEHKLLLKTNGLGLAPFSHELQIYVSSGSVNYYRIHPGWPKGMQLSESPD